LIIYIQVNKLVYENNYFTVCSHTANLHEHNCSCMYRTGFQSHSNTVGRSRCPRGRRRGSDACFLGLRVRMPLGARRLCLMNVFCAGRGLCGGPGSSVSMVTAYGLDGPRIESRWGEIFCTRPDRPWGPPSLSVQWVPALSRG
jgi:hypothetical protein